MKQLILTGVAFLFSTLTVGAQTGAPTPAASTPVASTPSAAAAPTQPGARPRHAHKHHTRHHHHHSGVNARR